MTDISICAACEIVREEVYTCRHCFRCPHLCKCPEKVLRKNLPVFRDRPRTEFVHALCPVGDAIEKALSVLPDRTEFSRDRVLLTLSLRIVRKILAKYLPKVPPSSGDSQ